MPSTMASTVDTWQLRPLRSQLDRAHESHQVFRQPRRRHRRRCRRRLMRTTPNVPHPGQGTTVAAIRSMKVWMWLYQQRRLDGRQATNPQLVTPKEGWFWYWYKNLGFPTVLQGQTQEEARAALDNLMLRYNGSTCKYASNNNADESRSQNTADERTEEATPVTTAMVKSENTGIAGIEEAIDHGNKFLAWLENCSLPRISTLNLVHLRFLLDTLKSVRDDIPPRSKANRKKSSEPAQQ